MICGSHKTVFLFTPFTFKLPWYAHDIHGFSVWVSNYLYQHIKIHIHLHRKHFGLKLSCSECGNKSNWKPTQKTHVYLEQIRRTFVCEQCEYENGSMTSTNHHFMRERRLSLEKCLKLCFPDCCNKKPWNQH